MFCISSYEPCTTTTARIRKYKLKLSLSVQLELGTSWANQIEDGWWIRGSFGWLVTILEFGIKTEAGPSWTRIKQIRKFQFACISVSRIFYNVKLGIVEIFFLTIPPIQNKISKYCTTKQKMTHYIARQLNTRQPVITKQERKGMFYTDLEIVRSVSGNLNVFTEKFLRKEGIYWVKNA